jgi:hypothetical protein
MSGKSAIIAYERKQGTLRKNIAVRASSWSNFYKY